MNDKIDFYYFYSFILSLFSKYSLNCISCWKGVENEGNVFEDCIVDEETEEGKVVISCEIFKWGWVWELFKKIGCVYELFKENEFELFKGGRIYELLFKEGCVYKSFKGSCIYGL